MLLGSWTDRPAEIDGRSTTSSIEHGVVIDPESVPASRIE